MPHISAANLAMIQDPKTLLPAGKDRRPIVEFAVENAQTVKKRESRLANFKGTALHSPAISLCALQTPACRTMLPKSYPEGVCILAGEKGDHASKVRSLLALPVLTMSAGDCTCNKLPLPGAILTTTFL